LIITIILTLLLLCVIVIIHEAGHMLAGKSIHMGVPEFSIGMGPLLAKTYIGKTQYSLRAILLGGYCRFFDDESLRDEKGRPVAFMSYGPLKRIYVLLAGPFMNFVLGAIIFIFTFSLIGVPTDLYPVIGEVTENGPAKLAGIEPGDRILSIDNKELTYWSDLSGILSDVDGSSLSICIERDGETLNFDITPAYDETENRYLMGVIVDQSSSNMYYVTYGIINSIKLGVVQTFNILKIILDLLLKMFTGEVSVSENVGGPVVLVQTVDTVAKSGLYEFMFLAGFLSINIGLMNLIPIPGLDGGKILLCLVEIIRGKKMNPKYENFITLLGAAVLISLTILITFKDIRNLFI